MQWLIDDETLWDFQHEIGSIKEWRPTTKPKWACDVNFFAVFVVVFVVVVVFAVVVVFVDVVWTVDYLD